MSTAMATAQVIKALETRPLARRATLYIDTKLVVSACRRHKFSRRALREEFVLKIGRPNYLERAFIQVCKKAGEPLPLRRVQLKFWPAKRVSAK